MKYVIIALIISYNLKTVKNEQNNIPLLVENISHCLKSNIKRNSLMIP